MMTDRKFSRRELLLSTAGIGLFAGLALMPRRASALSQQTLRGDSELGQAYANRCSSVDGGAHTQMISDLQAVLMKQPGQKGQVLTQTAYCPICGCPITATRTVD